MAPQQGDEAQARLAAIVESSEDAIIGKSLEGRITSWNASAERLFGFSADEAIGQPITRIIPPELHADEERLLARLRSGERIRHYETVRTDKSGRRIAVLLTLSPVRDRAGAVFGASTIIRDITESKKAEQALKESKDRLALALQAAGAGAWRLHLRESKRDFDDQVCRCLGIDPARFAGTAEEFYAAVHPGDRDGLRAALDRTIATGAPYEVHYRAVWPNGSIHHIAARGQLARDAAGRPQRIDGLVWDFTDLKRAEEALRESELRFRAFVTASSDVVYRMNPDWSEMRQLQGRGFIGDTDAASRTWLQEYIHPEDQPRVMAAINEAIRTQSIFQLEHRVRRVDRTLGWTFSRAVPLKDANGEIVEWFGAASDVTQRKQAEEELTKAREDLARANVELEGKVQERTAKLRELVAELEHFSYTITHDMRAPLRAMRAFAETVQEMCAHCPEVPQKELLGRIVTAADRMDALIRDALNYSRAVRQELPLELVDAGALLRGMLDSYPELQPSKARVRIEGEIPVVMGNEAGLTQCFSNLLGNAVKFAKPGQMPDITISAERRGERVRIWVADNGIGISKTMLPRVFDMFSRGHRGYEGTGIGLALVRKAIDRMGGKAGVESEEGKGSRFWVELRPGDLTPATQPG